MRSLRSQVLLAIVLTMAVSGCGASSPSKPQLVPIPQLVSDLVTSDGANYRTVITATGTGTRRFHPPHLRGLAVTVNCLGARSVSIQVNGRNWLIAYCRADQVPGGRQASLKVSELSIAASPATRWSLVIARRTG
jgi:hypothetical protein